jgi:hypothetical protein
MIGGCQGRAGPRRTGHAGWSGWLVAAGGGRWPGRTGRAGRRGAVQVLRATWIQQFCLDDGQVRWRDKHSGLPPGSRMILNPATLTPDPAANAAAPGVATRRTSPRPVSPTGPPDHPCGHYRRRHRRSGHRPRPPPRPRGPRPAARHPPGRRGLGQRRQILSAADDHGVQLTGPLPPDTSWQAGDDDAFD